MADNYTQAYGAGGRKFAADDIGDVLYPRVKLVIGADGANDGDLSSSKPMPVSTPVGNPVNRSGTITTGGTAQTLMSANAARRGWTLQNLSTGDIWVSDVGAAAASQPSLKVPAGALYETPAGYGSVGAVSVFGATTGQAFCAREW